MDWGPIFKIEIIEIMAQFTLEYHVFVKKNREAVYVLA